MTRRLILGASVIRFDGIKGRVVATGPRIVIVLWTLKSGLESSPRTYAWGMVGTVLRLDVPDSLPEVLA